MFTFIFQSCTEKEANKKKTFLSIEIRSISEEFLLLFRVWLCVVCFVLVCFANGSWKDPQKCLPDPSVTQNRRLLVGKTVKSLKKWNRQGAVDIWRHNIWKRGGVCKKLLKLCDNFNQKTIWRHLQTASNLIPSRNLFTNTFFSPRQRLSSFGNLIVKIHKTREPSQKPLML